ncbi:MAG: tRNA (adenosine(37)-N6)-threonylcarbamoyltransferase complex dimerization subunit type 1 TsaB [Gemmataceae bacterium]
MSETWLLIETSGRTGRAGLARNGEVIRTRTLAETRRLARDLAPSIAEMLNEERLEPRDVAGVMVSVGPGSYTGLRVGIASAKAFAYATGCPLIAVPTFSAISQEVPDLACETWVIADALQGLVYLQRYRHAKPLDALRIAAASEALAAVPAHVWLAGPGLATFKLNDAGLVPEPSLEGVLRAGSGIGPASRETLFALEPLYLRGSSAEEKADTARAGNAPPSARSGGASDS